MKTFKNIVLVFLMLIISPILCGGRESDSFHWGIFEKIGTRFNYENDEFVVIQQSQNNEITLAETYFDVGSTKICVFSKKGELIFGKTEKVEIWNGHISDHGLWIAYVVGDGKNESAKIIQIKTKKEYIAPSEIDGESFEQVGDDGTLLTAPDWPIRLVEGTTEYEENMKKHMYGIKWVARPVYKPKY